VVISLGLVCNGDGVLLKAETYKRLHTPNQQDYAYGWGIFADREWGRGDVIGHNGSNTMWYAMVVFLPELDAVMAVTANEGRASLVEEEAFEIFKAMAEFLK